MPDYIQLITLSCSMRKCVFGAFRPGLRQPGLFATKACNKFGTLSRVLGSWVAGSFVFRELGTTGKHFRELGRKVIFLLVSLELIPPWKVSLQLSCTFAKYFASSHDASDIFVCKLVNNFPSCRDGTTTFFFFVVTSLIHVWVVNFKPA